MQLACGFLYRGGDNNSRKELIAFTRHLHKCRVSFGNGRANKQNPERQQDEVCAGVCMANGGGKTESQWLETDIFSNKNRKRDTQQNKPLSDIIMSKRGKTGAGTHVALRIPWAIHFPTIFTYTGYGSGLVFWQQIIISLDVLKNMIWSIRKLSKIVSHVATRSFKPDCLHGDTEKCRRKC